MNLNIITLATAQQAEVLVKEIHAQIVENIELVIEEFASNEISQNIDFESYDKEFVNNELQSFKNKKLRAICTTAVYLLETVESFDVKINKNMYNLLAHLRDIR